MSCTHNVNCGLNPYVYFMHNLFAYCALILIRRRVSLIIRPKITFHAIQLNPSTIFRIAATFKIYTNENSLRVVAFFFFIDYLNNGSDILLNEYL